MATPDSTEPTKRRRRSGWEAAPGNCFILARNCILYIPISNHLETPQVVTSLPQVNASAPNPLLLALNSAAASQQQSISQQLVSSLFFIRQLIFTFVIIICFRAHLAAAMTQLSALLPTPSRLDCRLYIG